MRIKKIESNGLLKFLNYNAFSRSKKKKKKRQIKENKEEDLYARELSQMLEERSKRQRKKKEENSSNRRSPNVGNFEKENRTRKRHLVRGAVMDVTEI